MFAAVWSMALSGLRANLVRVEVDVSNGLPSFDVVGLATAAVREARDRVRSAIRNSGFQFPLQRVTVNLAPADVRKEGSGLDLPIAIGILAATEQLPRQALEDFVFAGELSLEGYLRAVPGILSMAVTLREGHKRLSSGDGRSEGENAPNKLVVPAENLAEARLVKELESYGSPLLSDLIASLKNGQFTDCLNQTPLSSRPASGFVDFAEIRGQGQAKRALEIAAAGGHNLLLLGPPGSGKTLLAKAYGGILPPLSESESMEVTQLYSIAGLLKQNGFLIQERPFRHPHHSATLAGMLGGGREPRPGEISLANRGVLFLDELPEFSREVLESLRQPLEDRCLTITRQKGSMDYPANISMIAAMNPCPCGFFTDKEIVCTCTPLQIQNYRRRISGPLLDRFDLHVEVPRLKYEELQQKEGGEGSEPVRERVMLARRRQWARFDKTKTNAEMSAKETREFCPLASEGEFLLQRVFKARQLSIRSHDRILRVARTIADLAGAEEIKPEHLAEALQYRGMDRQYSA